VVHAAGELRVAAAELRYQAMEARPRLPAQALTGRGEVNCGWTTPERGAGLC